MAADTRTTDNNVAIFVLEASAPYNILDFNESLCTMTGYTTAEFTQYISTLDKLVCADDFTDTAASVNYQLSMSNIVSIKPRIQTKDGRLLTVLCSGQAFSLDDGRDVLQFILTDITNLENAASETERAKTDLEIFANTVPSGLSKHLLDNKLSLIWANDFFFNMCGYSQKAYRESFGQNTLSIVYGGDLSLVIDALANLTEDSDSQIVNFRIKCRDGTIKWVNAVFARSGEISEGFPVVNLVMSDITDLKTAELKATLEEQKYLIISDISEELPYEYDIAEDVITFAEKFNTIFTGGSIIADPSRQMVESGLVSEDTKDALKELFHLAKSGIGRHSTEFKLKTRDEGYQWYFTTFSIIYGDDASPLRAVGLLRNINSQKLEQQQLISRAERDQMTGLYNKVTTETKIKEKLNELNGSSGSVLMLVDIDDFKRINDTYGHPKGDEVIIRVARALMEYEGEFGISGRLGGDEFCMFLTDVLDTTLACEKAKLVADRLKGIYKGDPEEPCTVTLSIGIAAAYEPLSIETLVEHADTALYHAKLNGKNRYCFFTEDMAREEYINSRN